jgi:hypothetical protein
VIGTVAFVLLVLAPIAELVGLAIQAPPFDAPDWRRPFVELEHDADQPRGTT